MLLRLGVSNFRSVREFAELSLVASEAIKDKGPSLLNGPGQSKVLPVILVYGANASGKSAIFSVMGVIKTHVRTSFSSRAPDDKITRTPFAFSLDDDGKPTHVDCDFVVDGVRYHYGFEFNDEEYVKEWLYSYPEGYRRVLFFRDGPKSIEFGATLKGRNKAIAEFNRPNSLFLSTAAQNSHPQLTPIYNWFANVWGSVPSINNDSLQRRLARGLDPRIIPFLRHADTGIVDAIVTSQSPPERVKEIVRSIREAVAQHHGDNGVEVSVPDPADNASVRLSHSSAHGSFDLPFAAESRGTRRLIDLLYYVFKAIDTGGVLFIDELDASLHTLLSLKIIDIFSDVRTNPNGAQLVVTTHDTNILCSDRVRRDQIWFVEKNNNGESCVYPLTDIKTRNTDNLEKGYLQGRFGAVPFIGSIDELLVGD